MLTCYSNRVCLPQSDLAYLAFRLAAEDTLCQIELYRTFGDDTGEPFGFLTEVPFLDGVSPAVQIDLLADVWTRHQAAEPHEASLRDAAIVYATCQTAARVIADDLAFARSSLRRGPRRVHRKLTRRTATRLEDLFDSFWDDEDFLSIEEFQDLDPDQARRVKELMHLPDEVLDPLFEALSRWHASPQVRDNLQGLFTDEEVRENLSLLTPIR